jgi:protein SCO1/2
MVDLRTVFGVVTLLGAGLVVLLGSGCEEPTPLPKLARVPGFTLTDASGESFHADALDGKVWVADFIFTSCPTFCPVLTEKMKSLRQSLADHGDDLHFVSISVDPQHDTPEKLRAYARSHGIAVPSEAAPAAEEAAASGGGGADRKPTPPGRELPGWTFLTGDTDQVTQVVVEGFKAPMGEPVGQEGDAYTILHARHFVLVDANQTIRGYYRTEDDELERLRKDVERLLENESAR